VRPKRSSSVISFLFFCAVAVVVAATARVGARRTDPLEIRLNHVPVVVSDLDAASRTYTRLGFALKEGRPHPNGLLNRHVKFPDGTEVELITAPRAVDRTTTYYQQAVRQGDGPAFLSLFTSAPAEVAARARALGSPVEQDGANLSWPDADPLRYVFFAPLNHSPTDRPEHFAHRNGAIALVGVRLAGPLDAERRLLQSLGLREEPHASPDSPGQLRVALPGGDLYLDPTGPRPPRCPVVGVTLAVRDLDRAATVLRQAGVPVRIGPGRRLIVDAAHAHGLTIELRQL
jgi:catechol 2,3-dioxygenase-like lactoylglutathione lyase family enzyme